MKDAHPLIAADGLGRHYPHGDVHAVRDVTFQLFRGEYVAIEGKSGSGKTTLLNLIGGLDQATSGTLRFEGRMMDRTTNLDRYRARHVGFVFQSYQLLPNLTAIENVQIPMFEGHRPLEARRQAAQALLESVGLQSKQENLPRELSGGECQRVSIARSLANDPDLLLADEPTGALDSETGLQVIELLEQLHRERGLTLVLVTHNASLASRATRRINLADGRVVA